MSTQPPATAPESPSAPSGEIVIRTIAMPADTNANGDVFGGWLMSQMDLGGAVFAHNYVHSRFATVSVDKMNFVAPVGVGDLVTCYAQLVSIGRTSLKVHIEAWAHSFKNGSLRRVTEGIFTYVAIDENGRPRPIKE